MENKNMGINEKDTSSPNHSENRDHKHLDNGDIEPNEGEFNNDEYNSEFDERDQKQNVGQIGDTYPPDDPTPTEDELSDINETSLLEDTSLATDSDDEREETQGNINLNRNETDPSINKTTDSDDHATEADVDEISLGEDGIENETSENKTSENDRVEQ